MVLALHTRADAWEILLLKPWRCGNVALTEYINALLPIYDKLRAIPVTGRGGL
jgi:hypothetical protein